MIYCHENAMLTIFKATRNSLTSLLALATAQVIAGGSSFLELLNLLGH